MRYLFDQNGFFTESVNTDEILINSTSATPLGKLKPKIEFPGDPDSKWIDGFTTEEADEWKAVQIKNIKEFYEKQITKLVSKYVEKQVFEGVPIPEEIINARQSLIDECNSKISDLSPTEEYK